MIDYQVGDIIVALPDNKCTMPWQHTLSLRSYKKTTNEGYIGKMFKALEIGDHPEGFLYVDIGLPAGMLGCAGCFRKVPKAEVDIFSLANVKEEISK